MVKNKEERLRRAREKVAKLDAATKTGGRADRMDWKPKALIWLHPDTDIIDRRRVWFSKEVDEKEEKDEKGNRKKKKKGKRIVTVPFVVSDDPECDAFYLLRRVLKENEDIDGEDVVLVVGEGRSKVEYRKGDVLGWDDFNFKKRLVPQQDFVCAAILAEDSKGKRPAKLKCDIFSGAKTLGKEIRKEIEAETDENGEENGNPFFRPYPFRIEFDESASGTDMYAARARPAMESDDELEKLFDADAPNLAGEITPDDPEEIHKMLTGYLEVDVEIPMPKKIEREKKEDASKSDEVVETWTEKETDRGETEEDLAKFEAEEKAAKVKAAKAKEAAAKEEAAKAKEEAAKAKEVAKAKEAAAKEAAAKEAAAKNGSKATTTRRKKIATEPPPVDDVKVPDDYDDPGPRPGDPNVGWWPDRENGEKYDLCPKCDRPVREDDQKCPHKDCGVPYASSDTAF